METQTFKDFFRHDEVVIANAARFLAEIKEKYEAKEISKSEYEELVNDTLEIQEISGLANDLDRKAAISRAFNTLKMIASFLPI